MIRSLLLLFIILSGLSLIAQNEKRQHFFVQSRGFYGKPIVYSDSLSADQLNSNFIAADIRIGVQANGERSKDQFLGFQQYGVGIFHANLNNEILGNPWGIYTFICIPLYTHNNFTLYNDASFGLGFGFNEYDPITNPKNDIIGSDINAYFTIGAKAAYSLNDRFTIDAGAEFQHFSNGTLKTPNKGLNMYSGHLGLTYFFNSINEEIFTPAEKISKPVPKIEKYNEMTFVYSIGGKSTLANYGKPPNYLMTSIVVDYYRRYHHIAKYGGGIEYIYDGTYVTDYTEAQSFDKYSFIAIHASHELYFSKFAFVSHLGTYLWKGTPGKGWVYARVGLRYYISEHFIANLTLKTENGFKADFIEAGIGYRFKFKKNKTE